MYWILISLQNAANNNAVICEDFLVACWIPHTVQILNMMFF